MKTVEQLKKAWYDLDEYTPLTDYLIRERDREIKDVIDEMIKENEEAKKRVLWMVKEKNVTWYELNYSNIQLTELKQKIQGLSVMDKKESEE